MYTDGGARGNPGPSAIGVVIYDKNNKKISEISKYIGTTTNNVAEYTALYIGVLKLKELKCKEVDMYLDSELIVRQLNGQYRIKDRKLKELYNKVTESLEGIEWKAMHVKRNLNKEADALVNKALDNI
jgi:ribonuclease HI